MGKKVARWISTISMVLKMLTYLGLLLIFLFLLSIENAPLLRLSRTMGSTIFTFCTVGLLMLSIYGKYDVGRRKSKPIIYSIFLATLITDVVAYLQLMIMNTNKPDLSFFKLTSLEWLFIVMIVQTFYIIFMVYLGNWIYFKIMKPEKCCIITDKDADIAKFVYGISRYKKQYKICRIVDYRRRDLCDIINQMNTVFLHEIPSTERDRLVNFCYENMKNIYITPSIVDIIENNAKHYLIDDMSILNANVKELTLEQRIVKRGFDLVVGILLAMICLPLFLICAIVIKVGDGGKIFFIQKRATQNGQIFNVYKFRTMKENEENKSATSDDERITNIGKFLRKTRLDELPQIINIIKGDMSFVGPRPEMLENVYAYTADLPEFNYRLRVKAGLTGYAQIAGKYNTSPKDKLILDMMYIENYTLWSDIKYLFQTAIVLLKTDSTEGFYVVSEQCKVEETPEEVCIDSKEFDE